jgi:hypothetical protein
MKFAWAVHTKFAIFLPRGRTRPSPRAWMDSLDAEVRGRSRLTPTCPIATALAALRLALDPGGRIAISPTSTRTGPTDDSNRSGKTESCLTLMARFLERSGLKGRENGQHPAG